MRVPSLYIDGYERAKAVDPVLADAYIKSTLVADPLADAATASLAEFSQGRSHRLIEAGMNGDEEAMREAPDALREFFSELDRPPPFDYDPQKASARSRVFYKYSDLFFVGLVLDSLVTGLSEGLAKAFHITGRTEGNLRRVRQNTRQLVEITLPGGMDRQGDGWKLTVRIRLIHAQVRKLMLDSGEWDVPAEGLPLNMAHMALAATGFSAIQLQSARKLGVPLTEEESDGYMHIWHYVTWLLGVPEELLFETEEEAMRLRKVAKLCEQPPGKMAAEVAHGYIGTVPELLGIVEPAKQKRLFNALYRTSRALMGNELADALDFPKQSTVGALGFVRMQRKAKILYSKVVPGALSHDYKNFAGMLQRSVYDDTGISYRMPDAIKDTASTPW